MSARPSCVLGRRWQWVVIACAALSATGALAATRVEVAPPASADPAISSSASPQVETPWMSDTGLGVIIRTSAIDLDATTNDYGTFVTVQCPESAVDGPSGGPALPIIRRVFCTPLGATVSLDVAAGEPVYVDLAAQGHVNPVAPMLRPASLTGALPPEALEAGGAVAGDPVRATGQEVEAGAYTVDAFLPAVRASVTPLGIVRGWQLHLLEVRPVAYDAVRGALAVYPQIEVNLQFEGGRYPGRDLGPGSGLEQVVMNPPIGAGRTGGNLLIITAQDFNGSLPLTQFINAKTTAGYTVQVWVAPTGTDRTAIKAYIQSLWGTASEPDYLLLVGDSTGETQWIADPTCLSYTIPAWEGSGAHNYVTDLPYICMDGASDWYPDIALGRIPARSVAQLQGEMDKILYVEAGVYADPTYTARAAMLASPDEEANAESVQDDIIDTYLTPRGITASKLYYDTYGARTTDVANAVSAGCFLVTYYGHSNGFQAWSAPRFDTVDIQNMLFNTNMYPFVIGFSCSGGQWHINEYDPGVIEQWVRVTGRGGSAGFGSTGGLAYTWSTWENVYRFLIDSIYRLNIRTLGPARHSALTRLVEHYGPSDPVSRDFMETFHYLGDPTMVLPNPPPENYLIVTAPLYNNSAPLNQFIAAKQAAGFHVMVYAPPTGTTNTAIRTYIHDLWGTVNSPDYVLLVGDTDGTTVTSAAVPHFQGGGSKAADTDWPYVCMDGTDDWYPELPIGRFSVRTVASLQNVVNKTLYVEGGNYPNPEYMRNGVFLANPSTEGQSEPTHNWVISNLLTPNGYNGIKVYPSQGGTTADVTSAINAGVQFVVYFGHSGSDGWWDPSFNNSSIDALTNTGMYPLACGWSCNTSHYSYDECYGEHWLRAANKGAAVYISASTYIYWGSVEAWAPSVSLEKSFFRSFFEDDIWQVGPAWVAGLYRFLGDYGGWDGNPAHQPPLHQDECRNFFEEFVILGDPALRLPRPAGFTLSANPATHDLCVPPDTQASYTIDVGLLGNFAGAVTLSAISLPPGATVTFTGNNQTPPFASLMTVSNLGSAPASEYTIIIKGRSGTKDSSTSVNLSVAHGAPGAPQLTTPANGATDVARSPALLWQVGTDAVDYQIDIARDANFSTLVYSAVEHKTNHTVTAYLDSGTQYFWRVQSLNGCGGSVPAGPFHFTTISQADYFTQQFTYGFDLDNHTIEFTPNGSGSFYRACGFPATSFPTDPTGGTTLTLADDGTATINVSTPVKLYGVSYSRLYVNANGNITFNAADGDWEESLADHFNRARISAVFDDLDPSAGGSLSWKQFTGGVAITWQNVPECSSGNHNTFQIEMFTDGRIRLTWLGVDSADSIVGLSAGGGVPQDYLEMDLSAIGACVGSCCVGDVCQLTSEEDCIAAGGTYRGDDTSCTPNPCVNYDPTCIIISEVVQGTESGDCPRWIEIANTGTTDFAFIAGGIIVQTGSSTDLNVDVSLAGVVIPAGDTFVINSTFNGTCTGAFDAIYNFPADLYTSVPFGYGDERLILTDRNDGSRLIDIYGQFGVDGTGQPWEFTDGYAYRLPAYNSGNGNVFVPGEWYFGGVGSLGGADPTALLHTLTTPGAHTYDHTCWPSHPGDANCDGIVDFDDISPLVTALQGPVAYYAHYPNCDWLRADCNGDGTVNFDDIRPFVSLLGH